MLWLVKYGYFALASIVGLLIFVASLKYWEPNFQVGFLSNKEEVFAVYRYFLYAHIVAAPIALFAGFFQFIWKKPKVHAWVGRLYAYSILLFAAPAGLYMAYFAIGGWIGSLGFATLASLWAYFTYRAVLHAKNGNFTKHEQFMVRSFILTNSAVAMRLLTFFNNHYDLLPHTLAYQLIAWGSWLPFLLYYELQLKGLFFRRIFGKSPSHHGPS